MDVHQTIHKEMLSMRRTRLESALGCRLLRVAKIKHVEDLVKRESRGGRRTRTLTGDDLSPQPLLAHAGSATKGLHDPTQAEIAWWDHGTCTTEKARRCERARSNDVTHGCLATYSILRIVCRDDPEYRIMQGYRAGQSCESETSLHWLNRAKPAPFPRDCATA